MKKIFLLIAGALLVSGCTQKINIPVDDTDQVETQIQTVAETISLGDLIAQNTEIQTITNAPLGTLPDFVNPKQVFVSDDNTVTLHTLDEYAFLLVYQPNSNFDLNLVGDEYDKKDWWSGILIKKNGETKWEKFLSISDQYDSTTNGGVHLYNPYSIFVNDSKMYVDIVDSLGAGSGEGNLLRLFTADGTTWQEEGCFYYVPVAQPGTDIYDITPGSNCK